MEYWSLLPEHPPYAVSSLGRVRQKRKHVVPTYMSNKFLVVEMRVPGGISIMRVRNLVASAFLPPRPTPEHHLVNLDKNPANCAAANLDWRVGRLIRTEIAGRRFGRLVAITTAGVTNRTTIWRCRCDCGCSVNVVVSNLTSGNTKSCGCLRYKR